MQDFDLTQAAAAVDLEHNIEKELTRLGGPLGYVLIQWRADAIAAAQALLTIEDPHDWKTIQALRFTIDRYKRAMHDTTMAVEAGRQAWKTMNDEDRIALADVLAEDQEEMD